MARPLFTGNYGSSLGNYSTAGQLLAARGQALGQAFQGIGQDVMNALEKHRTKKKQEEYRPKIQELLKQQGMSEEEATVVAEGLTDKNKLPMVENAMQVIGQNLRAKEQRQAFEITETMKDLNKENAILRNESMVIRNALGNIQLSDAKSQAELNNALNSIYPPKEQAKDIMTKSKTEVGQAQATLAATGASTVATQAQTKINKEEAARKAAAAQVYTPTQQAKDKKDLAAANLAAMQAQTTSVEESTKAKEFQNQVNKAKGLISVDTNGNVHVKQGASGLPPEVIDEAIFQKESQYWEGEMNKLKRLDLIQTTAGKKKQVEYTDWLMSPDRVGKTSSTEFERLIKDLPLSEQERLKKLRLKLIAPEGGSPTSLLRTLDHFGSVKVEGSFNQKFVADMYRKAGTEVGNYPYISEKNGEKRLHFKYATDVGKERKGSIKLTELVEDDTKHYLKLQDQLQTGGSASPPSATRPTQFDPEAAKSRMEKFIRQ